MSSRRSAWLARRIRQSRKRRSRAAAYAIVAALALLLLPIGWQMPLRMEESLVLKADLTECPTLDGNGPVVRQGSGTYNLDHPFGIREDSQTSNIPTWSQYSQDLWVDTYFGQKKNGTFIEVGGFDGETHSNTLLLEKERGWQGLLIEANPYSFQVMETKGRACWMVHTCLRTNRFSQLHFKLAGGITSALETASAEHQERIRKDIPQYSHQPNWKGAGETRCLPCADIETVLEKTTLWPLGSKNVTIDYFSLDVEGAELDLLEILLDETKQLPKIRLFTIEMQENTLAIRRFLAAKNYVEIATVGIDSVFVLKNDT